MFILILNPCTCPIMNVVFLHLNSHFQNVMFGIVLITSFFFYLSKGIYHKIKNISMDSMFMDMDSLFSGL